MRDNGRGVVEEAWEGGRGEGGAGKDGPGRGGGEGAGRCKQDPLRGWPQG